MQRQTLIRIVLVFVALVLLNVVAIKLFTRFDMTANKVYTLSATSKNLVKSLDDKFLVKAYFTADLPSPYNNNRRYLQDALDEYRAYAGGNFQYEFIDPTKPEVEQEAQRYGIPPVQVQVVKEDKMQVEKAYMGLVFLYGDKQEQLPVIQNLNNLEYDISSTIKKMTSKDLKRVGFLSGHGEATLDAVKTLKQYLDKQYTVEQVDLKPGMPITTDILAIVAPAQPFKDWEKYEIDQFIMHGGRVAFLLNKVNINLQSQQGQPLNLDIDDLLQSYGLRVNSDLVRDTRCAMVSVRQQAGQFVFQNQIPFPFLPMASDFDKNSPVVKDLGSVIFYFVSSVDTSGAKAKGLQTDVLVRSSKKAGRQENIFFINPQEQETEAMYKESGIPLAVSVEGDFNSAYATRNVATDSTAPAMNTSQKLTTGHSKIVVVGDGDFLQDQYSGGSKDNIIFASNLIDYLADDIGLAAIRSRETTPKPLDEVSEGTRSIVKGANLLLPPLFIVLFGIVRWRWRATMRKRLEAKV